MQESVAMNLISSTQIFYLSLSLIYFPPSKHNVEVKIYSVILIEIIIAIIGDLYAVVRNNTEIPCILCSVSSLVTFYKT